MNREIYLDWAATSYKKPREVVDAITSFIENIGVSSGRGAYRRAFLADRAVYECRKEASELFNVSDPARIVLTSGATESLNLVLKGYLTPGDHVVVTSLEHNAVIRPLHRLSEECGITYTVVRCDEQGNFDLDDFLKCVTDKTTLFCVNHASNVIGSVLPVKEIVKIAHDAGACVLLDAAQSAGAIKVDAQKLDVDFMAFAGHKSLLGPQGTGGLFIREGLKLKTLIEGGTGSDSTSLTMPENLPERFEAGTQNYPGIAGLNAALKHINSLGVDKIRAGELEIIEHALEGFATLPHVELYGPKSAADMTGVFAFNVKGQEPSAVAKRLDTEHGIMVRSGLHCAPLSHESIGTHNTGALRASIGYVTTKDDINALISALEKIKV